MSSLPSQATSITLLFLISFISISTSSLVDREGDPIQNGKTYYILTPEGGLTYFVRDTGPLCPLGITYEREGQLYGTPVKISSPLKTLNIALEERVILAFKMSLCKEESLVWKQSFLPWTGKKPVITTGGDEGARSFSISQVKSKYSFPTYELKYWPSSDDGVTSSNVGFYKSFLGLTESSTTVWFEKAFTKKAFDNVLELPFTS